jgi:hypothetical protein
MLIRNLTPHGVRVVSPDTSSITFPPDGLVARVSQTTAVVDTARIYGVDIPIHTVSYGKVEDLPEESEGVLLLVSAMVRSALPSRKDLVSPGELVRDAKGVILGCTSFYRNS